jgi:hypothetical protein
VGERLAQIGQNFGFGSCHQGIDDGFPAMGKAPVEGRPFDARALGHGGKGAGMHSTLDQQIDDCRLYALRDLGRSTARTSRSRFSRN